MFIAISNSAARKCVNQADLVLMRVELMQIPPRPRVGKLQPRSVHGIVLRAISTGCAAVPAGLASAGFELVAPAGGLVIRPAAGPPVEVGVARFSEAPAAIQLQPVPG